MFGDDEQEGTGMCYLLPLTEIFAVLTTTPLEEISALTNSSNSEGVITIGSTPSFASFSFMLVA